MILSSLILGGLTKILSSKLAIGLLVCSDDIIVGGVVLADTIKIRSSIDIKDIKFRDVALCGRNYEYKKQINN